MRYKRHKKQRFSVKSTKNKAKHWYLFDRFSVGDLKRWKSFYTSYLEYHWKYYCELAFQRDQMFVELTKALLETAQKPFEFSKWQRAVKYKWSLQPLSSKGSINIPGGRFNIPEIGHNFQHFSALYVSNNKETSLQELLGQPQDRSKLNTYELALTNSQSISILSVSGSIGSVVDLKKPKSLSVFIDLIKEFHLSKELKNIAKELKIPTPYIVKTEDELLMSLLEANWRAWPMQCNVPSPSQIFGQIVKEAGIEGILYPSKFATGDCLAIFLNNFNHSNSYIQLDDQLPSARVIAKVDATNWQKFC